MSTGQSLKKGPKRPQRSVARLDSIKNPQPRPIPQAKRVTVSACPNPDCGQTGTSAEEDGKTVCQACGTVISESNMVSDLTYGLVTGGQHIVHGFHVGADQAYAKRGDVIDKDRAMTSQQVSEAHGHRYITQIGVALQMSLQLRDMGMQIYKLAMGGFIQGRRIKSVAAVALYVACRTRKDTNTFMLIDFADVLEIDVFNLGHIYKLLLDHIRLNGIGWVVQPINPEDLILRFCTKLEFGTETMRVARDAVRIVQRMNRDWMTPGRRPAGICGAALILAARMNNFRRTVREVVYVVKVQEQTIFHRLDEFKVLESSGLTVEEFRTIDLERFADPPIFTAQREGKAGKKRRVRKQKHLEFDDDGDNDQPTVISSRATSVTPAPGNNEITRQRAQADSRDMPPPPVPIDPNLLSDSAQRSSEAPSTSSRAATVTSDGQSNGVTSSTATPSTRASTAPTSIAASEPPGQRKRGRKPKNAPKNPATPPATQRINDPAVDADITLALVDPSNLEHASALTSALESASRMPSPPATQQEPAQLRGPIPTTEDISDSEFASDPEVSNCLLTPTEIAIKTRIWTHENRDYLRAQSAKLLRQQLAEENGTARTIIRRKRKRPRMGDMSAYLGEDAEEGTPVAGSPAEAVEKMMKRRGWSSKLNYGMIANLYPDSPSAGSGGSSRRGSEALGERSPAVVSGGATDSPRRGGNEGAMEKPADEEGAEEASEVGEQNEDETQKELDTIAGALEDEGINDDEEDEEAYDDDPYEGGGDFSD